MSVQKLVPRFGRKVLQAGALIDGCPVCCSTSGRPGATASAIASWQMALPLVVMGVGMGLIVAPLTDAVLSEVPREHSGSASGLINTTGQMGNALGLGLSRWSSSGSSAIRDSRAAQVRPPGPRTRCGPPSSTPPPTPCGGSAAAWSSSSACCSCCRGGAAPRRWRSAGAGGTGGRRGSGTAAAGPGLLKARTRLPKARIPRPCCTEQGGAAARTGADGPVPGLRPVPAGARQPSVPTPAAA